jgi:hypothetical protein
MGLSADNITAPLDDLKSGRSDLMVLSMKKLPAITFYAIWRFGTEEDII